VRASAEVSELRAALDAASKDKATLSEQLAVLKTQLCFALQVRDTCCLLLPQAPVHTQATGFHAVSGPALSDAVHVMCSAVLPGE
jgi:hypothetical protein